MAVDSFPTLSYKPSPSTGLIKNIRLNTLKMGDGYIQRSADGVNNIEREMTLVYDLLDTTDANTLRSFLENHSAGETVSCPDYIVDSDGSVVRNWFIVGWDENWTGSIYRNFSIQLREVV